MAKYGTVAVGCGVLALLAGAAFGGPILPTVIYSEIASSPTSNVPGLGGAKFTAFDRPFVSADGSFWIISATSDLAFGMDEVIIVGSGLAGTVTVQEGVTDLGGGELVGLIDTKMGINDSGSYVFTTNTDAPTADDETVVRFNAGTGMFQVVARESDGVPGFPTETYGSTLDSGGILNSGAMTFRVSASDGSLPSDNDSFLFVGPTAIAQSGVTVPMGQAGGATEAWDVFDTNDFYVSANGATTVIQGDLTGDTGSDDVVVVNNQVRVQEGNPINGVGKNVGAIVETIGESNGNWWARGDYADDQDWLVLNGNVIAETGDLIPGGLPGETISDALFGAAFFTMAANGVGDFVWGATTSNADPFADAVLVVNNSFVLLRQGDQIDLDGDGMLDDVYIDIFNNDDMFLMDSGMLFFTAELTDASGADLGQAFLSVQIPAPAGALAMGVLGLAAVRRRR